VPKITASADANPSAYKGINGFMAALPQIKVFKPNKAADAKLYEDLK